MRWEITNNTPKRGETRFKTRFAFFPTRVLNKLTMVDNVIWLELYIKEQVWLAEGFASDAGWYTVGKTIHI